MKLFKHTGTFSLIIIALFQLLLLTGCATQRGAYEIIERTELPIYEGEFGDDPANLNVMFLVRSDGSVARVQMLSDTGDEEWDRAAADSLIKWKFSVPSDEDKDVWVQQRVKVQFLPLEIMNLGELSAMNEEDANVLYSRLRAGVSFEQLVNQSRDMSAVSGRYLTNVNTHDYPTHVSKVLIELTEGSFSRPVYLGGNYVIFKRFGDRIPAN